MNGKRLSVKVKKGTFQTYLIIFSLTTSVIFMGLLGFIYYEKVNAFLQEKRQASIDLKMEQTSTDLQMKLNDAYHTITNLKNNENIITYLNDLSDKETSGTDRYYTSKELERSLYSIKLDNRMIENILIITPHTQYSSDRTYISFNNNGIKFKEEVNSHYNFISKGEATEKIIFPNPQHEMTPQASDMDELNNKVFFGANIEAADGSSKGVILIFLNINHSNDPSFYSDQSVLLDQHNNLIYKGRQVDSKTVQKLVKQDQVIDGMLFKKSDIEIHHMSIPFYNLKLFYAEQLDVHKIQIHFIWKVILISIGFTLFTGYIFSRRVSRNTLQPLYRLLHSISEDQVKKHGLQVQEGTIRKKVTIRERLFYYFLMTIIIPILLFSSLYYWQTSKVVLQEIQESNYQVHENKAYLLSQKIHESKLALTKIAFDTDLQLDIKENDKESLEKKLLTEKKYVFRSYENISIFSKNNKLLYTDNIHSKIQLDNEFLYHLNRSSNRIHYDLQRDKFNNVTIVLGMPIYSSINNLEIIGYMTVHLASDYLYGHTIKPNSKVDNTFIVNEDNIILSSQDDKKLGEKINIDETITGKGIYNLPERYLFESDIKANDWRLISEYMFSGIQTEIKQLFLSNSYLFFIILLLALIFSYWIPKQVIKPLENINALFDTFDVNGSSRKRIEEIIGIDEIDLLQRNFNHNMQKMNQLVNNTMDANNKRMKAEYEKREIQMNALQSQVNPHFLYNTLDNLLYIVESNETEKAVDMITSLSRYFRFITNREKVIITLREEIAYTKTYINIMSKRFENFYCTWTIDENLLHHQTIKLILQPLIENAINHGVKQTKNIVKIDVSCKRVNNTLQITVTDNANGMDSEELQQVRQLLSSANLDKSGIYNVNARIKLYFGEIYGVNIESEWGKGTKVKIILPEKV